MRDALVAQRTDVVIGTAQEPSFIGVDFCASGMTELVALLVSQPLTLPSVTFDDAWRYFPVAFRKIPRLEDGDWKILPDGKMEVTWKLRKGLRWHDGADLTVHDFIFAWHVIRHPQFPASTREVANRIESIQAPDSYTMVVHWKKKYAYADVLPNGTGDFAHLPRHLLARVYAVDPGALVRTRWGTSADTPSTGPYRIVQWQKGSSMVLESWDHFPHSLFADGPYSRRPAIRRLTFRFLGDADSMAASVLSGAVDAFDETSIPFAQGLQLEKQLARERRGDWVLRADPGLAWEHVAVNTQSPKLSDRRVRWALLHAIDRERLVDTLFERRQVVAHQWLPPRHYGYLRNPKVYVFDVPRAQRLLEEAGWRRGFDGVRWKDGRRLELTLTTTAGNRTREAVQQILRRAWREIGVDVIIRNFPDRVLIYDILPNRKFELAMFAMTFGPTTGCEGVYTCDSIPGRGGTGEGQNFGGYVSNQVTTLCHAVEEEPDATQRAEMLHRMTRIWLEDLPALPLYYRSDYVGHKAALHNWKPTSTGRSAVTWNAASWRWAP